MRPKRVQVTLCVFLAALLAGSEIAAAAEPERGKGSTGKPPDQAAPQTNDIRLLLRQIRDQQAIDSPWVGDAGYFADLSTLAALPLDAPDRQRFLLTYKIGNHALRLGHNEKAVQHLEEAMALWPNVRSQVPRAQWDEPMLQLALAYLRLAEDENCARRCGSESSILPILDDGVYKNPTSARKAIEQLASLLEQNPGHLTARWLLNIAYMTIGGYPDEVPERFLVPGKVFESEEEFPRFRDVAPELGLNTFTLSGGAIADDFDNDGFLDIVTSTRDPAGQLRYFRNNGDGSFRERSAEAGFAGLLGGLNLIQADYDNDGDLDILVLRGAWLAEAGRQPNSLLRNDGGGSFEDVTFPAGLGEVHYPTQTAAWADYDNDGDLDLYIGNELFPAQLFQNQGDGTFRDVAPQAGVDNDRRGAKGVVWGDYDNDRFPDLYVSNLNGENRLYHNNRDGTFSDMAPKLGVTAPSRSFPVWFWDFNNDGDLDLFVFSFDGGMGPVAADYLHLPAVAEKDALYQGNGRGGFKNVTAAQNLIRVTLPMGCNFGDLDNDGFPDFYLGTGYPNLEGLMPNLLFHNLRGARFSDVTMAARVGHLGKGHGVSFADLDNDGDQDIFTVLGGAYAGDQAGNALFENPGFGNHSITLKLVGTRSNRSGIGARIRAEIDDGGERRSVYQWVTSGSSFGANPLRQQIGLGQAQKIETLEIFWPATGRTQTFRDVEADQFIEITEESQEYRKLPWKTVPFRTGVAR